MEERRRVTTVRQLEMLLEFLAENRDLALGRVRSKEARAVSARLWNQCAENLNSLGPGRTGKEWAKVWNDLKCRVRAKLVTINASQQATGGGPSNAPILSPLEERVANILGRDVGPMPNVRQDHFAGDGNVAEEALLEVVEEVVIEEQQAAQNSPPLRMMLSPVPSVSGQTSPIVHNNMESDSSRVRRVRERRRAERVARQPTVHAQAPQAFASRNALDENRAIVLKIEEMRSEATLNNSQAMLNISTSFRLIAESIDRLSRQYCDSQK